MMCKFLPIQFNGFWDEFAMTSVPGHWRTGTMHSVFESTSEQPLRPPASATRYAECPRCGCGVPFQCEPNPRIDSAGFETHTLLCMGCGKSFSGIIDPYDDAFLASVEA